MAVCKRSVTGLEVLEKMSVSDSWGEMKDDSSGFASEAETNLSKSMTSNSSCGDDHVAPRCNEAIVTTWDEALLIAPDARKWVSAPTEDFSFGSDAFDCSDSGEFESEHSAESGSPKFISRYLTRPETRSNHEAVSFDACNSRTAHPLPSSSKMSPLARNRSTTIPAARSRLGAAYSLRVMSPKIDRKSSDMEMLVPTGVQKRKSKQSLAVSSSKDPKDFSFRNNALRTKLKRYAPFPSDNKKTQFEFEAEQESIPLQIRFSQKQEKPCQSALRQRITTSDDEQLQGPPSVRAREEQEIYADPCKTAPETR